MPYAESSKLGSRPGYQPKPPPCDSNDRIFWTAIEDASKLFVKVYPGVLSQVVEGLEGMMRMPTGCFEQTLSSAYPNVALHQYLKESGQLTKETEARLQQMHSIAVQKILSFESGVAASPN